MAAPSQVVTVKRYLLDNARNGERVELGGRFFAVRDSSGPDVSITVHFNQPTDGTEVTFYRGQGLKEFAFDRFYLTNDAQAGAGVDVVVYGDSADTVPQLFEALVPPPAQQAEVTNTADNPVPVTVTSTTDSLPVEKKNALNAGTSVVSYSGIGGQFGVVKSFLAGETWRIDSAYIVPTSTGTTHYCGAKLTNNSSVLLAQEIIPGLGGPTNPPIVELKKFRNLTFTVPAGDAYILLMGGSAVENNLYSVTMTKL